MIRTAFIVDYLADIDSADDFSGAEISTELHAKLLRERGAEIIFLSYANRFYRKESRFLSDSFWLNPAIFFYGAAYLLFQFWKHRPSVIHVQGKNSLISAFLANLFYRHPILITIRDYKLLCNLGMCFLNTGNECNLQRYLSEDIPFYAVNYSQNTWLTMVKLILLSPIEFTRRYLSRRILKSLNKVICISRGQEEILRKSGVFNTTVIYNPVDLSSFPKSKSAKNKTIAFVGRYSPGKGQSHVENILNNLCQKHPEWKLMVIGTVLPKHPNLICLGHQPYRKVLSLLSASAFTIVPSMWPEPFGRAALDSIGVGTPVVVTNKGGLPEIVDAGVTGLVSSTDIGDFWKNTELMISSYEKFSKKILTREKKLENKFNTKTTISLLALYQEILVKKI